MKKLTLDEIGKLAGVSRATVSRVVNGYPHIRPEIRERVAQVIAETGFRPNAIARSLASKRSNMIGLVVPSIVQEVFSDPYFPSLIQGVAQAAGERGQILSLYLINNLHEERRIAENIVSSNFVDGLILALGDYDLEYILAQSHTPFVTIGQPKHLDNIPFVDADNLTGGYRATKHLLDLGHRRIGIIAVNRHVAGEKRYRGYANALKDYGLQVDPALVAEADFSVESAYVAVQQLLPHRPSALFVSSDRMALAVMKVLKDANLRVPQDMALVGFDDLSPALTAEPPLTTIHQPVQGLGVAAVNLLLELIEEPEKKHKNVILPTELIIRDSCGGKAMPIAK